MRRGTVEGVGELHDEDVPEDDDGDEPVDDEWRRRQRGPRSLPQRRPVDTWGNSGP